MRFWWSKKIFSALRQEKAFFSFEFTETDQIFTLPNFVLPGLVCGKSPPPYINVIKYRRVSEDNAGCEFVFLYDEHLNASMIRLPRAISFPQMSSCGRTCTWRAGLCFGPKFPGPPVEMLAGSHLPPFAPISALLICVPGVESSCSEAKQLVVRSRSRQKLVARPHFFHVWCQPS